MTPTERADGRSLFIDNLLYRAGRDRGNAIALRLGRLDSSTRAALYMTATILGCVAAVMTGAALANKLL